MRLIVVLFVVGLTGCAHAPWKDNYAISGQVPESYSSDKSECHDQAWAAAKEEARTIYSGVFPHLFGKHMDACMKGKGYERVSIPSRVHRVAFVKAVQVGRE